MSAIGPTEVGFSLLEMLVVLAVSGLVAGLSFPVLQGAITAQNYRSTIATAEDELITARANAIAMDTPVRFIASQRLAADRVASDPRVGIVFYPDGSSSGGKLTIVKGEVSGAILIDRATGAIRTLQ